MSDTPAPAQADEKWIRDSALRSADNISDRIIAGGYRAKLSDVEELRNHVRKLVASLDRAAIRPEGEAVAWRYRTARWHDGQPGPWAFTDEPALWRSDARYDVQSLFVFSPAPAGVKVKALTTAISMADDWNRLHPEEKRSCKDFILDSELRALHASILPPSTEAQAGCASTPAEALPAGVDAAFERLSLFSRGRPMVYEGQPFNKDKRLKEDVRAVLTLLLYYPPAQASSAPAGEER